MGTIDGNTVPELNIENAVAETAAKSVKYYVANTLGLKPVHPTPLGIDLRM